jgi:hypothetical protein
MWKIKKKQEAAKQPESTGDKCAIAIPHGGTVDWDFMLSLRNLLYPVPSMIVDVRGCAVDEVRNYLVELARRIEASHILMIDSDIILQPDAFNRLYSHNLPVVSGLYSVFYQRPRPYLEG